MATVIQLSPPHTELFRQNLKRIRELANSPSRDSGYTRTFYSYPAKFQAHLPATLIKIFTKSGELVADPYCGGGTTGLESMLLERRFIGYDMNPFAIFISRVKTTKLDPRRLLSSLEIIMKPLSHRRTSIFDEWDERCLGAQIANEINSMHTRITGLKVQSPVKDFFKLALIHSIKIVGRRDFDNDLRNLPLFAHSEGRSIRPLFRRKSLTMVRQLSSLPRAQFKPVFRLGNNNTMALKDETVDLIVTSPPYKDLDVEYSLIQIQRPELSKSKRSDVVSRIIGKKPVPKSMLCGGRGESYWESLKASLAECARVLKRGHLAFFWTGFTSKEDFETFIQLVNRSGFFVLEAILAQLGSDRVASSRSTHHGRDTGMLKSDYLFAAQKL